MYTWWIFARLPPKSQLCDDRGRDAMAMTEQQDEAGAERGRPARERVYLYVREQILRGRFAGGSFVEEEEISSALGVSRTPVREAFHRLEAERFIDLLPRRGALVRQVTAQELLDLYEARRMIEGHAISRICREEIPVPPEMAAIIDELDRLPQDDYFERIELNRRFHFVLVAAVGNGVLSELYQSLGARQQRVAMTAISTDPSRITRISREHRALLSALSEWNETEALAVLEQHLRPVVGVVSRLPNGR
jgi:DNA-binding GntR family transcriptional regulator